MTHTIQISVVIGTYNQAHVLSKVLDAYTRQSLSNDQFEVILADSSSMDHTSDIVDLYKHQFNLRHCIIPNQGKAFARNYAVRESMGDFIIITDADMIPDAGFIEAHLQAHRQSTQAICFEGAAFDLPDLSWPPNQETLVSQVGRVYRSGKRLGWWYFLTGNLSMPKQTFNAFSGFSEAFKGYGWEDLELGYRMFQSGIKLLYLPEAINYHYHVISDDDYVKRNIQKGQSARLFLSKHPELKWFLGLNPLSVAIYRWLTRKHGVREIVFNWARHQSRMKQRIGYWITKEYYYLSGILDNGDSVL